MFRLFASLSATVMLALVLGGCGGQPIATAPTAASTPTNTVAPTNAALASTSAGTAANTALSAADLDSVKRYTVNKASELKNGTAKLKVESDKYYELAKSTNFDYAALWKNQKQNVIDAVQNTRAAWTTASPLYEQMEGIVAGTPSLAQFDVDLDAGTSAKEDPESAVSFDLKLPDGRTLPKPGNLFGVTESTLWGTFDDFKVKNVEADFNGDGKVELGDVLPDANVLKGAVDLLDQKAGELVQSSTTWQPTAEEAFGALVGNVPTVGDFMETWKNSRFVQTDPSKASRDFVVVSRLSDIVDNVTSWQTIYSGLSPAVVAKDKPTDEQIQQGLRDLKSYVEDIHTKEQQGKRYTPEEADLLTAEAQNRATAITGQLSQVAAELNVKLDQQ